MIRCQKICIGDTLYMSTTTGQALINLYTLTQDNFTTKCKSVEKLSAINSTAHWAHKQELQKRVPHRSQEGSAQEAPSPPHLGVQPVQVQKSPDLSYQHPLHCHQKGLSASHRAFQVTLLLNTHTEDQTGTSIDVKIWPHLLLSCSSAGVMVSWMSEHE